jgi:signal transduction histidine kinase/ligand-binding sensor domain-containing protein/DNA-binding response OmpR family regulator
MAGCLKFLLVIAAALFFLPRDLCAQTVDLRFQHFSTEDGLPDNRVNAIFQDHLGFLWFGTDNGLVRYDGYEYQIYQANTQDSLSPSGNRIISIHEDQRGDLWIGTEFSGVNKFERSTGHFYHFRHEADNVHSLSNDNVFNCYLDTQDDLWIFYPKHYLDKINTRTSQVTRYRHDPQDSTSISNDLIAKSWNRTIRGLSLAEDTNNDIWIGTELAGLNKYNRETDNFTRYPYKTSDPWSLGHKHISRLFEDSRHNFWVGTWGGGISQLNRKTGIFARYRHQPGNLNSLLMDYCFSIFESWPGDLWVTLDYAIDRYDPKKNIFTHYSNKIICPNDYYKNRVWILEYEDETGNLWFRSSGGSLVLFNPESNIWHVVQPDPENIHGLPASEIISFFQDASENLWFGTGMRGVSKYDPYVQNFTHMRYDQNNPSISDNNVNVLYRSGHIPNAVWIGTDNGLDLYFQGVDSFSHTHSIQKVLEGKKVLSLQEDEPGILWIGTAMTGLYKYILDTKEISQYSFKSETGFVRPVFSVWSMFKDTVGDIWILKTTKPRGLYRFDKIDTFARIFHLESDTLFLSSNSPWCIHAESDSSFWVGMDSGLYLCHMKGDSLAHYLKDISIFSIFKDSKNNIWLGTQHNGLGLFDFTSGSTKYYGIHNKISSIIEDARGYLWLGTENGLAKFDPATKNIEMFYREHGLLSETFLPASMKLDPNTIWMTTADGGIVIFNPKDVKQNPVSPKMVFTDFRIFNESIAPGENSLLPADITATKEIHLAHWQNDITFECAALHYSHSEKNQYAFRLENYDDDWYSTGTNRVAAYTNLDPGEYILHAKGSNSDGVWNEDGTSLRIFIHPPWWATIPVYLFYVLVFSGLVFATWRLQLRRIHLRHELKMKDFEAAKLKEVDAIKSQFFANISHEFRTPLTLILGPLEKLFSRTTSQKLRFEYAVMLRNGRRLLRLINQLLDFSQLETGQMKLKLAPFDLARLAKSIIGSFASVADQKSISLTLEFEKESMPVQLDQDKIEKIFVNLLSNALKFTPDGGTVRVGLNYANGAQNQIVEMRVSDTGPGIPPEQLKFIFDRFYQVDDSHTREHEGTGIGLALTKELVQLHGGQIDVQSSVGEGATFTVRLPVGQVDENALPVELNREEESLLPATEKDEFEKKPEHGRSRAHILIVDDNQDVRYYIKDILKSSYKTTGAKDGLDGFEKAASIIPDLIISDVMMPGLDGFKLSRKLKSDERTSHIPVILLTAKAAEEHKLSGLETGADAYLIKPFNARELSLHVKNLIEQRRQLRQRFSREITLQPKEITITSTDEQFLRRAMAVIEHNMSDSDFNVGVFGENIGLSHAHLHRKLRALVDQSPTQFIRTMRLKRALALLKGRHGNVSEIAYEVGFNNPAYFSECFRKQFGASPTAFRKKL